MIAARRNDLGLTQEQAADRASLSLRTYTRIESGEELNPLIRRLANIAIALELHADAFFAPYAAWLGTKARESPPGPVDRIVR